MGGAGHADAEALGLGAAGGLVGWAGTGSLRGVFGGLGVPRISPVDVEEAQGVLQRLLRGLEGLGRGAVGGELQAVHVHDGVDGAVLGGVGGRRGVDPVATSLVHTPPLSDGIPQAHSDGYT